MNKNNLFGGHQTLLIVPSLFLSPTTPTKNGQMTHLPKY